MLSCFTCVWLFVTLRTVAHQAPFSLGFSRQEYCSGLPCPSPGKFSQTRDRTCISRASCIAGGFFTHWATWELSITFFVWHVRPSWLGLHGFFHCQHCHINYGPYLPITLPVWLWQPGPSLGLFQVFFLCLECSSLTEWLILQQLSWTHLVIFWVVFPQCIIFWGYSIHHLMIDMSCLILLPNGNSLSARNIFCSTSRRMISISAVVKSLALV